ncbi:MAG: hypothetical protein WCL48_09565, partial [Betaproteobacteria bacterium]
MSNAAKIKQELKSVVATHPSGLTPHTTLVAALLYMMSTDGDLAPEEIATLQESVGKDENAIPVARTYIKKNKFSNFLKDANEILDRPSKLCVLANVYECMHSDGVVQKAETNLFQKMQKDFGFTDKTFDKVSSVLITKNGHAVLGTYEPEKAKKSIITPHLILAASILYMMSADGEVSNEEIGQLSAVINPYEGLQSVAMAYVEKHQLHEFVPLATKALNAAQKTYILLNLCDSMLIDGFAEPREVEIFNQFLEAFGYSENAFQHYYSVIHIKNVKPFESKDSSLEVSTGLFQNIINDEKGGFTVTGSGERSPKDKLLHDRVIEDDEDGEKIRRTMDENTKNVKHDFGSKEHLAVVTENATSTQKQAFINQEQTDLNVQKAAGDADKENVQKVKGGSEDNNIQNISSDPNHENTQKLNLDKDQNNIQSVENKTDQDNVQSLPTDGFGNNIQSIHTGSETENKAKIEASEQSSTSIKIPPSADGTNIQNLEGAGATQNNQKIDSDALGENLQSIDSASFADNHQAIDSRLGSGNKAKILADDFQINVQAIENKEAATNTLTLEPSKDSVNKVKFSGSLNLDNKANPLKEHFQDQGFDEKNHVLSNLVKETQSTTKLERMKHLGSQLEDVNSRLNQIESVDRSLPISMQPMVERIQEQLNQQQEQNKAKIPASPMEPNRAVLSTQPLKDEEFREGTKAIEDKNANVSVADSNDFFLDKASHDIEDDFKNDFK